MKRLILAILTICYASVEQMAFVATPPRALHHTPKIHVSGRQSFAWFTWILERHIHNMCPTDFLHGTVFPVQGCPSHFLATSSKGRVVTCDHQNRACDRSLVTVSKGLGDLALPSWGS